MTNKTFLRNCQHSSHRTSSLPKQTYRVQFTNLLTSKFRGCAQCLKLCRWISVIATAKA